MMNSLAYLERILKQKGGSGRLEIVIYQQFNCWYSATAYRFIVRAETAVGGA
jgi:hypothetical protein